jgi:putative hydrolase of the HAD superfamily
VSSGAEREDTRPAVRISHLFFDVGGVLGTAGWGSAERARAVEWFGLDAEDFDKRHHEVVGMWEEGRMALDEYLDHIVFGVPRPFTREEFTAFMRAQSAPDPEAISLVELLAGTGRYRLMTINNESEALNVYRLRLFGLNRVFDAFFSSCWLGVRKPSRRIFELALAMAQASPECSAFIDDRGYNLEPARVLGMHTVHFTGVPALRSALAEMGVRG